MTFISRFTPSAMSQKDLETIFVQREELAKRIIDIIRNSALTKSKHYTLLVGPRGIGKTHLISIIYHRLHSMVELNNHLIIGWLREEEWGISSFFDLLLRILDALQNECNDKSLDDQLKKIIDMPPEIGEYEAAKVLKNFIGNRTLLILIENLDALFAGLGDNGQKKLRSYLQENPIIAILAGAQSLFSGISLQTSPFYGFFRVHHLDELDIDNAILLLSKIAQHEGDFELAKFICSPLGRSRIRVLLHLAGGNHRIFMIFSQFLTRDTLDALVDPFMWTIDDLTPYYQARMAMLSPQQQKIIDFLIDQGNAIPVKEIARRCHITHQTTSSQLKSLRKLGYVRSISFGRESYYELQESLMRICFNIKKYRGTPIRLFVDFLRIWYSREELQHRLVIIEKDDKIEKDYIIKALKRKETETIDIRVKASLKDLLSSVHEGNFAQALPAAEEVATVRGRAIDWVILGECYRQLERYQKGLDALDKAVKIDPRIKYVWLIRSFILSKLERYNDALSSIDRELEQNPEQRKQSSIWEERTYLLKKLERYEEALISIDRAIEIDPKNAWLLSQKGSILSDTGRDNEALTCLNRSIKLNPNNDYSWALKGILLVQQEKFDEALTSFNKVTELDSNIDFAWAARGYLLLVAGSYDEALISFDKSISLNSRDSFTWTMRGLSLEKIKRYDEALASINKALELEPTRAYVWLRKGSLLEEIKRYDEALVCFDKSLELDPKDARSWIGKGFILEELGKHNEALSSLDKAIKISVNNRFAWYMRGVVLTALNDYEKALMNIDKAIELGIEYPVAFFYRSTLLQELNRTEEFMPSLEEAIRRSHQNYAIISEGLECILHNLIIDKSSIPKWRVFAENLLDLFDKYKVIPALRLALVQSTSAFYEMDIAIDIAMKWLNLWKSLVGKRIEFELPLRFLKIAIQYKKKKDPRLLMKLPVEERRIMNELINKSS